jgi:hypothetical protein
MGAPPSAWDCQNCHKMPELPEFENQLQFFAVTKSVLILNGLAKSHLVLRDFG